MVSGREYSLFIGPEGTSQFATPNRTLRKSHRLIKNSKIKTLLVGCGRIGAGSGTRHHRLSSHAGVLSEIRDVDLFLFDTNPSLAQSAASILEVAIIERIEENLIKSFDCVVICSSTITHFEYLEKSLQAGIPLIVCEKPVCASMIEVGKLRKLQERSKSKVLVNYTRRFQPAYAKLKKTLTLLMAREQLRAISVRYQRGFLNNATHALDLILFLTELNIQKAFVRITQAVNDEIPNDPTLSCHGDWNGVQLSILGLPQVRFSFFEIDFFFERSAIRLRDRGDTIEVASSDEPGDYYAPLKEKKVTKNNLKKPIENFYHHVMSLNRGARKADNFSDSLDLSNWALGVLEKATST